MRTQVEGDLLSPALGAARADAGKAGGDLDYPLGGTGSIPI